MSNLKSEVKLWLESVLAEDISDFTLEIEGNSEKGDGFTGEILFVNLCKQNIPQKELHLALKCSNRSAALRAKIPMKQTYENEIYIYDVVCKTFTEFQEQKGVTEMFNGMPKYYGCFIGENVEVIVFENLKKSGYELWDKRKPVTTKHLEIVLEDYGKWHALSVALRDQQPEKFQQLSGGLANIWQRFCEASDLTTLFRNSIEEALDLLKNELDETTLKEWLEFSQNVHKYMSETPGNSNYFSLITHGDSWNNNFMYKIDKKVEEPLKVAILDWQLASLSSPILDLANFIYCCASKKDLDNLDVLLKKYHASFSTFAAKLGTDVDKIYPLARLLADWGNMAKYGMIISISAAKMCLINKEEIPDLGENMEKGLDFSEAFAIELKDSSGFKARARFLMEHAVKWEITKPNRGK